MFRRVTVLPLVAILLAMAATAPAQVTDPDVAGVYFDPAYTVTEALNTDVPHQATGYLVLHNPTQTGGGLGGWECRIEHEGYQPLTMWNPQGPAVNYATPPDFIVGYTDAVPVIGGQVLLATFDMFIEEPTPFQIELVPLRHAPSIPDAMAYIPWDDKEILTPMTTTTGVPVVASYNWVPYCETDRTTISFGIVPVDHTYSERMMVTNVGGGTLVVDPVITGSEDFSLSNTNLPADLGPDEWMWLWVDFDPVDIELQQAELDIGTGCDPIPLSGLGRDATTSYTVDPESWHFGSVTVGDAVIRSFLVANTGETDLWFSPQESCGGFSISGGTPRSIGPGDLVSFNVTFNPLVEGLLSCDVSLGPELGEVHVTGVGIPASEVLELSVSTLEFGTVYLGESIGKTFTVTNTGNVNAFFVPTLTDPDGPFRQLQPDPGTAVSITPGYSRLFEVAYEPTEIASHAGQMEFGGSGLVLPLFGECADQDSVGYVTPRHIDYGRVAVNGSLDRFVYVNNTTDEPLTLAPSIEPEYLSAFVLGTGGTPGVLPPGESRTMTVTFAPTFSGEETGTLDVGPGLPQVTLEGEGYNYSGSYDVEPNELVFGLRPVGSDAELECVIMNRSATPLVMDVHLQPDGAPFVLSAGGSLGVIPPNSSGIVRVRFQPTAEGHWEHELFLAAGLARVPVRGTAAFDVPLCNLSTEFLEFPPTATGLSSVRTVTVTNTGTADIELDPSTDCAAFTALDGWGPLAPGESRDLSVAFSPEYVGVQECVLDLGDGTCADVIVQGEAFTGSPGAGEDLVGIYFEESYEEFWINGIGAHEPFTGYLVLKNPSLPADISGWELRLLLGQNVLLFGSEFPYVAVNFSAPPEFTVGIADPVAATSEVVLATFEFFSFDVPDEASISLVPKLVPSIPDAMALISLPDHELRPMYPGTGIPEVAWVNHHDPTVGNDDPVDETELPTAPQATRLLPNVPNPFNPETAIHFEVAREGRVRIDVFDVMGRRVATLLDEVRGVGADQVVWRGRDNRGRALPSGAYYVRLEAVGLLNTRKVMLLK